MRKPLPFFRIDQAFEIQNHFAILEGDLTAFIQQFDSLPLSIEVGPPRPFLILAQNASIKANWSSVIVAL